jgi:hypothetical protein
METNRSELTIRPFSRPEPFRTLVLGWRRRSAVAETLRKIAQTLRETVESGAPKSAKLRKNQS